MSENSVNLGVASRRQFIKSSGSLIIGSALAPAILAQQSAPAEAGKPFVPNGETLKVGLIGCGGRGTGAAEQALSADPNVMLTAMGDAFDDRMQKSLKGLQTRFGARVKVTPEQCFSGFDSYQKVIDSGVHVVLLASPPGFRPMHLKAAVDAGKHIFCEKPMATDAPGLRSVIASAQEAKKKKLSLVCGFCWRYNYGERAGIQQIHEGAIGDIRSIYSTYNTGSLWCYPRREGWTDMEWQMRNWYYFPWLSGDHIVEQAVHSIDKMIWAMKDAPPVRAVAHGGRQVRTAPEFGNIYDHFSIVYDFANGAKGFLFCRQQDMCSNDNSDTIMGTKGIARILGFTSGPVITGEKNWKFEGNRGNMYQTEHNELFASIRAGKVLNDGDWMTQSTMMALLGRMAAYTGKSITWEEAMNSQENLFPAKLDWKEPLAVPPIPMPGKTKFI